MHNHKRMPKRPRVLTRETAVISILVLCLLGLYSLDRARLGHSIPDEKRYIQSTREMAESGDYITPRYHGKLRFQKPILFYWLIMSSYKLFGVSVFGARLPSVVAALLNVILIYLLGRDLFGKKAGIFSALVLSTSEVYFMYSRFATPDMTFLLFITASIYLFIKAYHGDIKGNFRYLYMYATMALAMLTKGPLGLFYPMAVISAFLIIKRDWAAFKDLKLLPGLLVFAAISAPWFIAMIVLHGGEYLGNVWFLEIVKKLKYVPSKTGGNLLTHYFRAALYYAGMVFARHLPWTIFLPAALISRQRYSSGQTKSDFTLITAWFFVAFVSLVLIWSKESYYVLAVSMPLSLFLGRYFSRFSAGEDLSRRMLFRLPFIVAIAAYFLVLLLWLVFIVYILDEPIFSFSLLVLAIPILMARAYSGKNKMLLPLSFFVASFVFFAYFAGYIVPTVAREPLSEVAGEIKAVIKPGDIVGVASSAVSFRRLNALLEDYKVIRVDKRTIDRPQEDYEKAGDKKYFINEFLGTEERRIFCVIAKEDYYKFIDEELRGEISIIDRTFIWKRFHKQDKVYFKELVSYFLEGRRGQLKQALKEEIYLLSNR